MMGQTETQRLTFIRVLLLLNVVAVGWMGYKVAEPYWYGATASEKAEEATLKLPAYNHAAWEVIPVLEEGRIKPLQTVAVETVRQVVGRAKLDGQPAMAVLLSWIFYDPKKPANVDWENYSFILCEDHELRAKIFDVDQSDPAASEKVHGKRIAPAVLRQSENFRRLLVEVAGVRKSDPDKFQQKLNPIQKKALRVRERLDAFDQIISATQGQEGYTMDPIHYVALDKVPESPWFSMAELRYLTTAVIAPIKSREENSDLAWWGFLQGSRVLRNPKPYLSEEAKKALSDFQEAIKEGKAESLIVGLEKNLTERMQKQLPQLIEAEFNRRDSKLKLSQASKMSDEELKQLMGAAPTGMTLEQLKERIQQDLKKMREEAEQSVRTAMPREIEKTISDLRKRVATIKKPYVPEEQKHNQMYMDYLEARFPDLYQAAVKSQPFPAEPAKRVLASFQAVATAYRSGESASFESASQNFFQAIADVSKAFTNGNFPGVTTIDIELSLNRVEPFKWSWIAMLGATILFALAMKTNSRWCYVLGFLPFFISLSFQLYAYYGRCMISGRAPVSNMFETVVFVASMSAVFALVLEAFYRSKIIILSGSAIATLGMILADQLPYSSGFDAKIDPLQPVLRSNYWLIIHVMTIVASYAAGALAWAIGNISLVMYWFNSDRKDLLKTMANFSYAAIKVAVLLLGVGTLLGGIWAAESWGRFWGWDPKETWALIALVIYIIPLHARYIGWVKDFGMAVASVVCFAGIVMSWYGVNFILGAGLHSYGMGDGGPWTIFLVGSLNLLGVLLVCHRRASRETLLTANAG